MLVGYLTFEINAAGNYHSQNIQAMLKWVLFLSESIQIDPGQFNTTRCGPL